MRPFSISRAFRRVVIQGFILCSLPFLFSSCHLLKVLDLITRNSLPQENYSETIPIRLYESMVLVKVWINGKEYEFLLDTGAFTVVSGEISSSLLLNRFPGPSIVDSQGHRQRIDFTELDSLRLGNLTFYLSGAGIYDFNAQLELSCFPFQGILGANLLRYSVCQIDPSQHTLTLTDRKQNVFISDQAVSLPFKSHLTGSPVIDMEIEGVKVRNVIVDYGSGSGFDIASRRLLKKLKKTGHEMACFHGKARLGLFGGKDETTWLFQSNAIKLGNSPVDAQYVTLSKSGFSTIGMQFLSRYRVTFDYPRQRLYLEELAKDSTGDLGTFGFTPTYADGKLIIGGLFEHSPAEEAGIQTGDQLLEVDGKEYSKLDRDQYCELVRKGLFNESLDTVNITFRHDTLVRNVMLIKRPVIR